MATPKFSRNLTCRKCEWNIGEAVEQKGMLCGEVVVVVSSPHQSPRCGV